MVPFIEKSVEVVTFLVTLEGNLTFEVAWRTTSLPLRRDARISVNGMKIGKGAES